MVGGYIILHSFLVKIIVTALCNFFAASVVSEASLHNSFELMCFSKFIILQSVVTRYLVVQKVMNCCIAKNLPKILDIPEEDLIMPTINQRIFSKSIKAFEDLKKEYDDYRQENFNSDDWSDYNPNVDIFSEFVYTADNIYVCALNVVKQLEFIVNNVNITGKREANKYKLMLEDTEKILSDVQESFRTVINGWEQSGTISEVEQDTLDKLTIKR